MILNDIRAGAWRRAWWWRSWLPWNPSCDRTGRHEWAAVEGFPRCRRCGL